MSFWAGAILVTLFMIFAISAAWTQLCGAPWVPSSMPMVHTMLTLADVGPEDLLYDLGCGDARMIVTAARKYGARAVGIEIDPLRRLFYFLVDTVLERPEMPSPAVVSIGVTAPIG